MPTPPNSHSEISRTLQLENLIDRLQNLSQLENGALDEPSVALTVFDGEAEQVLTTLYGSGHERLQSYKYAILGEAEAMVNLPESAQLPAEGDEFKKSLQQRRQVLQGCIVELREAESVEVEALTGEDREDPPALG